MPCPQVIEVFGQFHFLDLGTRVHQLSLCILPYVLYSWSRFWPYISLDETESALIERKWLSGWYFIVHESEHLG